MRKGNAATGAASSKTMRSVPGTGCPVRTEVTTPAGAGRRMPRAACESGRSTTSRCGAVSDRVRYWPAPCSWISARVPVAPCSSPTALTWPAQAAPQHSSAASTRPTLNHGWIRDVPWRMGRIQSPCAKECKYFSLNNPEPEGCS